tara:strand:- start:282 stop:539 length:258 start_codon:yes stop_codon:yes gene_type:complete
MKKFLIKITAYGYITDFTVMAEDSSEAVENEILDKLGKNDINWEKSNFYDLNRKWLTFEEVIDGTLTRPIQTEKVSGVELGTGAS